MTTPTLKLVRNFVILLLCCLLGLCGCGAMLDSMLGNPESCQQNCEKTYQACVEQMGTPDANHYCLNRRNQCFADC